MASAAAERNRGDSYNKLRYFLDFLLTRKHSAVPCHGIHHAASTVLSPINPGTSFHGSLRQLFDRQSVVRKLSCVVKIKVEMVAVFLHLTVPRLSLAYLTQAVVAEDLAVADLSMKDRGEQDHERTARYLRFARVHRILFTCGKVCNKEQDT